MNEQEILETTQIHSLAGSSYASGGLITTRPFRSPHHTAHMVWTRISWNRMFSVDSILKDGLKTTPENNCYIYRKFFDDHFLSSVKYSYKRKKLCVECFISSRNLLIDCGIKPPAFEDCFGGLMQDAKKWAKIKKQLFEYAAVLRSSLRPKGSVSWSSSTCTP